jgi:hypothetical protein
VPGLKSVLVQDFSEFSETAGMCRINKSTSPFCLTGVARAKARVANSKLSAAHILESERQTLELAIRMRVVLN